MTTPIEFIQAEAMKLLPDERADLAEMLWRGDHSAEDVKAVWDEEIVRRIRQIDTCEVECVPWDTVMTELRAKYG